MLQKAVKNAAEKSKSDASRDRERNKTFLNPIPILVYRTSPCPSLTIASKGSQPLTDCPFKLLRNVILCCMKVSCHKNELNPIPILVYRTSPCPSLTIALKGSQPLTDCVFKLLRNVIKYCMKMNCHKHVLNPIPILVYRTGPCPSLTIALKGSQPLTDCAFKLLRNVIQYCMKRNCHKNVLNSIPILVYRTSPCPSLTIASKGSQSLRDCTFKLSRKFIPCLFSVPLV